MNAIPQAKKKRVSRNATRAHEAALDDLLEDFRKLLKQLGLSDRIRVSKAGPRATGLRARRAKARAHASAIGELLTYWHQDPNYLDRSGDPIALPIEGKAPSFRELAERSVPNLPARYLLEELSKLGAVKIEDTGVVTPTTRSLPVYKDSELAALHTLRALRGFIQTLNHNLGTSASNLDQLFHRIAWNGDLEQAQIPRLKIWLQRHGQNFLESADNWMKINSRKGTRTGANSRRGVQTSIGIYLALEDGKLK